MGKLEGGGGAAPRARPHGWLGLLGLPSVSRKFVVEQNSLTVTSLAEVLGKHDNAIGNFDILSYGGSMTCTVVYPKDRLGRVLDVLQGRARNPSQPPH